MTAFHGNFSFVTSTSCDFGNYQQTFTSVQWQQLAPVQRLVCAYCGRRHNPDHATCAGCGATETK